MKSIPELLEQRRTELGESAAAFSKRLRLGANDDNGRVYYSQIVNGKRPFPKAKLVEAAMLLGKTTEELATYPLTYEPSGGFSAFTGDEYRYLGGVVDALGYAISHREAEKFVLERRKRNSPGPT